MPFRVCVLGLLLLLLPTLLFSNTITANLPADMVLNGSAAVNGSGIRLTSAGSQAGSAWYQNKVKVADGFIADFTFTITPVTNPFSDGLAFVIQNVGTSALGGSGGGIGYDGISNSVAVEFDTHQNFMWDPNDHHVALESCGKMTTKPFSPLPNSSDHTLCGLNVSTAPGSFSGQHSVEVVYIPGSLVVILDGHLVMLEQPINLGKEMNFSAGGLAYVGFTGATGGGIELADINSFVYTDTPEPSSLILMGSALAGMAGMLKKKLLRR